MDCRKAQQLIVPYTLDDVSIQAFLPDLEQHLEDCLFCRLVRLHTAVLVQVLLEIPNALNGGICSGRDNAAESDLAGSN